MRKNWLLLILATVLVTIQFDANAQQQRKEKYRNKANDPVSKLPYYKKLRWADGLFKEGSYFVPKKGGKLGLYFVQRLFVMR